MIRDRLLAGTISNFAGKFTAVVIWFVLTPFLLDRLGPSGYALWVLMGAIASYGFLLDFGIGGAVVKYVAQHAARGEHEDARIIVASAVRLYSALALAAFGASVLLSSVLPRLLGVAADDASMAAWVVIVTGANVAVTIAFTPPMSVLRGLQRYDLYNAISIGNSLLEAAVTVAALLGGFGVLGIMALYIPVSVLTGCASTYLVKRVAPEIPIGWTGANVAAGRQIGSFSASLFAIQLASRLQTKTDEFVIAALGALVAVTPYSLARKLGGLTEVIAVQLLKVVMPLASQLDASAEREKLRQLYVVATRVALGIAVPITVALGILGGPILAAWVGPQYVEQASVVTVLALSSAIATSQWPAVEILQGMASHRIVARTSLAAGAANLTLSILLFPSLGLFGIALGTLIPAAVGSLFVVMPFAMRMLHIPRRTALREIWLPTLLPGCASAALLWMLNREFLSPSAGVLVVWLAAAAIVYVVGYLTMPASAAERDLLVDVLTGGSRRLKRIGPAFLKPEIK